MNKVKFTKGDAVKTVYLSVGVREALLSDGWKEDKPKPVKKTTKKKED